MSPTSPARATTLAPGAEVTARDVPPGGWCALRPAWECVDAATIRRWWPKSQRPEPPPGVPHSYVVYGRRGARTDLPPSPERGSSVYLVLHEPGETPRELRRLELLRKGAIVVSVVMRDRFEDGPVPPSAKKVTVRGSQAYLIVGGAGDDDFPVRLVVWKERRGAVWFVWLSTDGQPFRSDDELVATLNSLGRT